MNNRNNKLENVLKQFLLELDVAGLETKQKAYVLDALMQLNKATKDEEYLKALVGEVSGLADRVISGGDSLETANLANFKIANAFYYAAEVTGEDKYIDAAKKVAEQLGIQNRNDAGIFVDSDGKASLGKAYLSQVFYMKYETANGGKEHYNDVIAQYNAMRNSLYDEVAAKIGVDVCATEEVVQYCAALIDTMEVVDQPLYEIFRRMQDLFKEAVKALIEAGTFTTSGASALRASYAVLKGCRMKALHTEKYEQIALKVLETAIRDIESGEHRKDLDYITALSICYSESLKNRAYQDYGRGKGGALWS